MGVESMRSEDLRSTKHIQYQIAFKKLVSVKLVDFKELQVHQIDQLK